MRIKFMKIEMLKVFFLLGLWIPPRALGGEMGIWDCVRSSITAHPRVRAGLSRLEQAKSAVDEDRTLFKPELSFGARYAANTYVAEINLPGRKIPLGGHNETTLTLQAGHLLYDWGRRENKLQGDKELKKAGWEAVRSLREGLAFETGSAYLSLLGARRELQIALRNVEIAESHHRHLVNIYNQEMTTYDEVLKAEVDLDRARILASRLRNQVELARARLLEIMGLPLETEVSFRDSTEGIPEVPPEELKLELALSRRPDLAVYDARLAALESFTASYSGERKPEVRLFAGGNYGKPGVDMFRNEWITYGQAGVKVDWNFWDWGRKDFHVAKARAEWDETVADRRDLEQSIALELENASLDEKEAADRVKLAGTALNAAKEHFRIVSARFDQAQVTNKDCLDARESAMISEFEYSGAVIDLVRARWRIAYVCGRLAVEIESRWPDLVLEKDGKSK